MNFGDPCTTHSLVNILSLQSLTWKLSIEGMLLKTPGEHEWEKQNGLVSCLNNTQHTEFWGSFSIYGDKDLCIKCFPNKGVPVRRLCCCFLSGKVQLDCRPDSLLNHVSTFVQTSC